MKLKGKHTGLKAGDIFEIWETPKFGVTFEVTRKGEKLEFESDSPGLTKTYLVGTYAFHFINKIQDFTGFEFKQIEGATKTSTLYLLE